MSLVTPLCSLACDPTFVRVSPAATRRRESEKSLENETFTKEDDAPSPSSKPKEEKQPLKVMPAPPPKENAWVKRSSNPPARSQSSDSEQHSPTRLVPCRGLWGGRPGPLPSGFAPCQEGVGDQILSPQAVNSSPCSMPLGSSSQGLDRVHHHLFFFLFFYFLSTAAARRHQACPWKMGHPRRTPTGKVRLGFHPVRTAPGWRSRRFATRISANAAPKTIPLVGKGRGARPKEWSQHPPAAMVWRGAACETSRPFSSHPRR